MRRVLMISPHFPPDSSAGTHRVRLLAPHLSAFEWEPTIVTLDPSSYEGHLDPDLARLVPETLRVVRAQAWPASLTRRFGIGDLGLRALTGIGRVAGDLLRRERFDALFITTYPTYPAMLGPRLKSRHGVPFVLDLQDPWVGAWGLDVGGRNGSADLKSRMTRALARRMEPSVVRGADALTAVSAQTYQDVLERVRDARPRACAAIPLGFEEQDLEALRRAPRSNRHFDERDGLVHVCYVGTVLPKGLDVVRAVFDALRALRHRSPDVYGRLRVHFLGTSNQRDPISQWGPDLISRSGPAAGPAPRVLPLAREAGVADIVREVPARLDYMDALDAQMKASALLLLGSSEPHYTPSKVFPAILSRRPIVAIYHEASSVVDLLREPAVGATVVTFGPTAPVATCVNEIAREFECIASPGLRTSALCPLPSALCPLPSHFDAMRQWSARAQAGRLAGVLDEVAS